MELTLVRGLPGAGKSTYGSSMFNCLTTRHVEADMFFVNQGTYKFQRELLSVAHDWCFSSAVLYLNQQYDVVVTNTFTSLWELDRYMSIPQMLYDIPINITIVELKTQFKSIHGIPDEIFDSMSKRWEEIPPSWKEEFGIKHIIVTEV